MTIRILLADDYPIIALGLRKVLEAEDEIEIAGVVSDLGQIVSSMNETAPDVVVLDCERRGAIDPIAVIAAIRSADPNAGLVTFSSAGDLRLVRRAFAAGATGFVLEGSLHSEVVAAVRTVFAGGMYVNPELGARLGSDEHTSAGAVLDPEPEGRESRLLRLLALGHTNEEIATQLHVAVGTVKSQRARLMRKFALSTRVDLVRHAIRLGLLADAD
ncbi:MAG TPA: response regulator transcription factor [Gaiellaceae bacterium]|nr:response regulator transcription factor [Gaiellaceae bacterium]